MRSPLRFACSALQRFVSDARPSPQRRRCHRAAPRHRPLRAESLEPRRVLAGPYAPAAGQSGSTALAMNDPAFVGWATGWSDYEPGPNVDAMWQTPELALGPAVGTSFDIVSLGDNGEITLTFDRPLRNGPGADLAVFENGVTDTFLELAYVEVSSNGADFFRFANDSRTPAAVGAFGSVDPTNINGYGGKYRQGFGTPFDLADLADASSLLNINRVAHVRLVDIRGNGSRLDSGGDPIYDPDPTVGSGGFDLDAVGVIHAAEYEETLAGFEDVGATLASESAWIGPDPTGSQQPGAFDDTVVVGDFESEGLRLNNIYSLDYNVFAGWAYSNTTDTVTPGPTNQTSAFPGIGADGSPTYAVAFQDSLNSYPLPRIELADAPPGAFFASLKVTNTTYAARSMLQGDAFAKKFGGPTGDEPDWFLLTIYGKDATDHDIGSVEVYLADYRSADNAKDYLLDDWTSVNLAPLREAASLEFKLTSSDVGAFGMNTPGYFALDQVVLAREKLPLSIAAASIPEGAGAGATTHGTVARTDADLSQPLVVALSSSDLTEASVPATVTIPAGAAEVQFSIDAVNDSLADGPQTVTIHATAAGYAPNSKTLEVSDDDAAQLTLVLGANTVSEGAGAMATKGTVTRNTPTNTSLTVTLSSSDATAATVPASVVIPAGQASAQFNIAAVNDAVLDGLQTTTITASATGLAGNMQALDVTDDDVPQLTVDIQPQAISESDASPAVQFEDVGAALLPESFWNGADGSGGFTSGGLAFNNHYNAQFGVWDGWAFSNTTDVTTSGFGNQYSAIAGSGDGGSATYGVAYAGGPAPTITLTDATAGMQFRSLRVTNTTYAALSMLQGDPFAKKFGGETGDDPDWFLLTIEGRDAQNAAVGQVEFYLADYRFADSQQDYVVQDWAEVDLTSLVGATQLAFSLSSSDVGAFGMNTPAYVAVDDIALDDGSPAAAMGTVTRNDLDLSQPLTVQLSSSDATEARVPLAVTIPVGETSTQFLVAAVDDAVVDGPQTVTISASAEDYQPGTGALNVNDDDSPQLTLTIAPSSISEAAGAVAATAGVHRNTETTGELIVTLASSQPGEASVPPTVTIPAGAASVEFAIDANDEGLVDGVQTATITASAEGFADGVDMLDVTDDDTPQLALSLDVAEVSEDGGPAAATGTVTRNTSTAVDLTVQLTSSDATAATAPVSVVIPAGQTSVLFAIDSVDDALFDGVQFTTITASAAGFADGEQTLQVTDDDSRRLTVTVEPSANSEADAPPAAQFEDVGATLPAESFWNGSDGSAGFTSAGLAFNNNFNAQFGVWDGWAFSNTTDSATPGFGNQYSAIPGSGAGESATYGVAYAGGPSPTITLTDATAAMQFRSLRVTNTTYAALSILQGDAFAKKFGGPTGDDPDWFLLTIEGRDSQGAAVGQVEFYLADYRFADSQQDYVVQDWTEVDLSSLAGTVQLAFSLSSSDVGAFGMNTPAYVAVDDIALDDGSPAAAMGTVTRNDLDLSQPLVVQLSSSDSTEAAAPAAITIPAGQASAQFPVNAVDDALVDGPQTLTISASAMGYETGGQDLTVNDDDSPTLTVVLAASSGLEGDSLAGRVFRNTVLAEPLAVSLSTTDASEASVPAVVTIPTGATSVEFTIQLVVDGIEDGDQLATITAEASGFSSSSAEVTVLNQTPVWQNPDLPTDVDDDGAATLEDLLLIVAILRDFGNPVPLPPPPDVAAAFPRYPDPTGDEIVSLDDLLAVVTELRTQLANAPGGEAAAAASLASSNSEALWERSIDAFFSEEWQTQAS